VSRDASCDAGAFLTLLLSKFSELFVSAPRYYYQLGASKGHDMKRLLPGLVVMLLAAGGSRAPAADRWLHIRVDDTNEEGERVRVNVPLELAEKVIPCIHADRLQGGRVKLEGNLNQVVVRALMEALRSAADGEFVTVQNRQENVRVAKQGGSFLVTVREQHGSKGKRSEKVDIKVPFPVVQALLSGDKDELDVAAALRSLKTTADTELVSVNDGTQTVRIWVDSRSTTP